jgi:hypothetical protein
VKKVPAFEDFPDAFVLLEFFHANAAGGFSEFGDCAFEVGFACVAV